MAYHDFLHDFEETIRNATARLQEISADESNKSLDGEWSPKQIVGHLIDSAANNHQRFVRAQFTDTLEFPGYEQEQWVSAQKYSDESWADVIELWRAYNMHLLHVFSVIPQQVLTQPRDKHNLDEIAFRTFDRNTPATLDYLIRDYVDHLKHHLDQIWRRSWHTPTNN
jgi:DinB superfamily